MRSSWRRFCRPQCVSNVAAQLGQTIRRFSIRVVVGDAVDVIKNQRHGLTPPVLVLAAELTASLLQAFGVEPLLEVTAAERRALDKDGRERRALSTRLWPLEREVVERDVPSLQPSS